MAFPLQGLTGVRPCDTACVGEMTCHPPAASQAAPPPRPPCAHASALPPAPRCLQGLKVIACVGETLEQRDSGHMWDVLDAQLA